MNKSQIESPCIGVCTFNSSDECKGCHRTVDEVREWYNFSDNEKQTIINRLNDDYPNRKRR